jgi:hypothetical protein
LVRHGGFGFALHALQKFLLGAFLGDAQIMTQDHPVKQRHQGDTQID